MSKQLVWNEVTEERDVRCKTADDQVEMRRRMKRLVDCELPEGIILTTPQPQKVKIAGQIRWAFELAYVVGTKRLFFHLQRYEPTIPDDVQMGWALDEFTRDLEAEGYKVASSKAAIILPKGHNHQQIGLVA